MVVRKVDLGISTPGLELDRLDRELADRYETLHPDVSNVSRSLANERSSCSYTEWHWMVVDMLRLTLINLLHRPRSFRPFPTNVAN